MGTLIRIIGMAWRYRVRLTLAYTSFFAAIAFSLLIPHLFGTAVDGIVGTSPEDTTWVATLADPVIALFGSLVGGDSPRQLLVTFTVAILAVSLARGFFDFARF